MGEQKELEEWMALGPKKRKMQLDMVWRKVISIAGAVTVGVLNVYAVRMVGLLFCCLREFYC
jgi:hypothetical protein